MRGLRWVRSSVVAALVVALGVLAVPGSASGASAPPPVAQGSTAGGGWDVTTSGTGEWVVRLTLPAPVPIRAAQPQLAVDGVVLGAATQDADGRTLRIRTTDSRVTAATRVELAWNGVVAGTVPSGQRTSGPVARPAATGPLLAEDPAAATTYRVQRADYDLGDTAVRLPGLAGQAVELRAAVYLPAGAPGPRPVVVFLHGRHQPCYGRPTGGGGGGGAAWPCPAGTLPVPSHLGYGKAAEALAAAGEVVVSISADGINALDYAADDGGAEARGELVLAHLDQLAAWNAGRGVGGQGAALVGRLDLTNVGLMGHSRGGEGVVKAALLNAERPSPYGIRAVMPLAPVDFLRSTLPGVPMAVVLPYCDGDVWDQQGQHFYDDSRYSATDDVLRTSLLVMGANHNYFNSEWTPGVSAAPSFDDWFDEGDPVCGKDAPSRLTPAEQRAVGASYISGFFRLHLAGERQFLPMFDGTGARAASVSRAVVHTEAQQPQSSRVDLAPLQAASPAVHTTAGVSYCASYAESATPAACASSPRNPATLPHWVPAYFAQDVAATPVARMTWGYYGSAPQQLSVDVGRVAGRPQALTFRAATARSTASDLLVTVTDTAGHSAGVQVSRVSSALSPLPALSDFEPAPVAKTWLRTVRLPLTQFAGVDTTKLATVTVASAGTSGSVFLSDLALDSAAPGAGGPSTLPVVSVTDADAFAFDRPMRATVTVTLSRPSAVPVTAQLQIGAGYAFGQVSAHAVRVTIPVGATSVSVPFAVRPARGGGGGGGGGPSRFLDCVAVPTNAIVGDGLGVLNVYG